MKCCTRAYSSYLNESLYLLTSNAPSSQSMATTIPLCFYDFDYFRYLHIYMAFAFL